MKNNGKQHKFKTVFFLYMFLLFVFAAQGQSVGENQWLEHWIDFDALTVAKGSVNLSSFSPSINDALQNPARLNEQIQNNFTFNYSPFFSVYHGGQFGYVYQNTDTQWKNFSLDLKFIDYGNLKAFDVSGNSQGELPLQHLNIAFGTGMPADKTGLFKLGVQFNWLSSYWLYDSASVMSLSFGLFYHSPKKNVNVGLKLSGLGFTLKNFENNKEYINIPIELELDTNIKLENAPLILHFGLVDVTQIGSYIFSFNGLGQKNKENTTTLQKYLYHLVFGTDVVLSEVVQLYMSYRFKNQDYRIANPTGIIGLSAGLSVKTKYLALRYGKQFFGAFGSTNHITLEFKLKKT